MFELPAKEGSAIYWPFRDIWFEVSLSDPGAFYVTLGNAAVLSKTILGNGSSPRSEANKLFSRSLVHLGNRLNNPEENTSPGTIANILAHICLTVVFPYIVPSFDMILLTLYDR